MNRGVQIFSGRGPKTFADGVVSKDFLNKLAQEGAKAFKNATLDGNMIKLQCNQVRIRWRTSQEFELQFGYQDRKKGIDEIYITYGPYPTGDSRTYTFPDSEHFGVEVGFRIDINLRSE